jgi:hypothetical protein
MRNLFVTSAVLVAIGTVATGCNRQEVSPPAEPMAASAPQPRAQPMSVTGCLKAGEADNTFVLTVAAASGSSEPATYQLVGKTDALREHVGERVEISGTLESEQEFASRTTAVEQDRAKATSGTPTVETTTRVELRRLDVSSFKPISDRCEP